MMDTEKSKRKQITLLIIASAFSILIVVENVPHAAHSLLTIFSLPPEPQTSLIVGAYVFLPLALLWASWAYLRKGKHPLISFPIAACAIFLTMDYWLPYPGPVKETVLIIDEGRKIYEVGLENSGDTPFLTKQGNPIGISLNYTMSMPAGGKYLIQTHLSPTSRPLQTSPATQQSDPAGKSISSSQAVGTRHNPYRSWRRMADREEASEPDWLSPLATTSGRIKNELRYDIWSQTTPTGSTISTFGGGKGLEFIAVPRVQLLLGVPSYIGHSAPAPPDGFGDWPLMLKFRVASANASNGDYLVTLLLSATVPTASRPNGSGDAVVTPTLALGKGWRGFDVQTTFGANLPAGDTQRLGRQWLWNTTFQYRAGWKLWPELEANSTFYEQGPSAGETQTFLTPGLGFGRVRLLRGLRFSMAGGVQIAVTRFHTYDRRSMLSVRFPF